MQGAEGFLQAVGLATINLLILGGIVGAGLTWRYEDSVLKVAAWLVLGLGFGLQAGALTIANPEGFWTMGAWVATILIVIKVAMETVFLGFSRKASPH